MSIFTIHHLNGQTLFECYTHSFKSCMEIALQEGTNMSGANLRRQDLSGAMLDGGRFQGADFTASNLTGANMSECDLSHAIFKNCCVISTCFAESALQKSDMRKTQFGATDITDTWLDGFMFSTLSGFDLDFITAASMKNCNFYSIHGTVHRFSSPPLVLKGASVHPLIKIEHTLLHGHGTCETSPYFSFTQIKT